MAIKTESGEWLDSRGRAVAPAYIPKIDKERDKLVERVFRKAEKLEQDMRKFKDELFEMVEQYLDFLEQESGGKSSDWKGNLTLTGFSGDKQVEVSINEIIDFDERLSIAKSKIDECLKKWSENSNGNIRAIVHEAFNVDKKGRVNTHMILRLTRLNIRDALWKEAMQLIRESINVRGSRRYVNIRRRKDAQAKWETVNLNFSSI